ncbi:flavin reductase family protein [Cupriavidus oxalaticus]|uniref:Flavin reductase n=1 Tax=Cupriavidus oxalaticus TaxID=96344 RepID=A0A375GBJ2_9BURK|nr:flavin reductase family protein [Cupriavidus oxalaticus]QRQ83999.1 flavin reductase family protein [Cupriavidus oxalaticus]QRQ91912.1 flavin reductase family protein [Cupriavidus oxalaticus]WQD86503.1 flavin reductase family protein [Cupriavidus oxalaticus]SPC17619.1 Flavin reductase [Cupriavidus oxalaticus]
MAESSVDQGVVTDADAQRRFRNALAMFATGVAVITAPRAGEVPVGITVASFNSVSLDPPLVLFSVDRRCLSLADLRSAPRYAVNVLAEAQQEISNRFARANSGKWDGIHFGNLGDRHVLLPDTLATFECEPYAMHDGGDHVIFIGRVVRHQARHDGRPLIFFGGKYRALEDSPAAA